MPCNLSAFVMGFVLKEYVDGFSWSDGLTNDVLTVNKLQEMVDEIIKLQITANPRYKDKSHIAAVCDTAVIVDEFRKSRFVCFCIFTSNDWPHLLISKIKNRVEELIKEGFNNGGRISIVTV